MGNKDHNPANPWDSLGQLEAELLSANMLDNLFLDYGLDKNIPRHKLAMAHMQTWHAEYHWDIVNNAKEHNCIIGKIVEFLFCESSLDFNLDFHFVMNWDDPFSFDCFMVKGPHEYIPAELKTQRITMHPAKPNEYNIQYDTFLTLRESQIPKMCKDRLPILIIDRDIDVTRSTTIKAKEFARKFKWTKEPVTFRDGRTLHLIDIESLCLMRETKTNYIELNIPTYDRGKHNGEFTGDTIGFSSNNFPMYRIR